MAVRGVAIERNGPVATIVIEDYQATVEAGATDPDYIGVHEALGMAVEELRWDDSVRVVVLTGRNDGEFYRFARRSHWEDPRFKGRHNPLKRPAAPQGAPTPPPAGPQVVRQPSAHEGLLLIDKPVIARVNGDVIGFGSSILWACDLILAWQDAKIAWGHTGLGEIVDSDGVRRGFPWAMTPCYGTAQLLFMPPTLSKEFQMTSRVFTGGELAERGIINWAGSPADLDDAVQEAVDGLVARPASVLARTKRVINKRLVEQYNMTEELAAAYGILDFFDEAKLGRMD